MTSLLVALKSILNRLGQSKKLTILLMVASLLSCIATYMAMTSFDMEASSRSNKILILLNLNLTLLLTLSLIIGRRLWGLWENQKQGTIGSKLHVRLVILFCLLAAIPTLTMTIFSYTFFNIGVQAWFNERVNTALDESKFVADAYLKEHEKTIRSDAQAITKIFENGAPQLLMDPHNLEVFLNQQVEARNLTEAMIVDTSTGMRVKSRFTFSLEFEPLTSQELDRVRKEQIVVQKSPGNDKVRALAMVNPDVPNLFLYIGRLVDPQVLKRIEQTATAVGEYKTLKRNLQDLEVRFGLLFGFVAFLLLLMAIWIGLRVASQFAAPIAKFISAAQEISRGDLQIYLEEESRTDELGALAQAFNHMSNQLNQQRLALVSTNATLEQKQKFTQSVLSGVSAGVVGLDKNGLIHLPNESASRLLNVNLNKRLHTALVTWIPEVAGLLEEASRTGEEYLERKISIIRNGYTQTLKFHIEIERTTRGHISGYVVTFDDITALQAAERNAAWSDVARRIAHEIKNPLTPIQLSAERLKRKYIGEIKTDPEVFLNCIDTIVRQVTHMGEIISEFSRFARMPAPKLSNENLNGLCEEALILQKVAHTDITFQFTPFEGGLTLSCDRGQIGQVLTNLLQNAIDSVHSVMEKNPSHQGRIDMFLTQEDGNSIILLEDNGEGFPKEGREQLFEPYVTRRAKGTGLGLSIVKKIIEDHDGRLTLEDSSMGSGARVRIVFKNTPKET